jgi:hypothetical protein
LHGFGGFDSHPFQRLAFGKTFSATDAAVSLDDSIFILKMAETLGFAVTTMTIQLDLSGRARKHRSALLCLHDEK